MAEAVFFCCVIAYIAFRNWLNHDKRRMIHRERMIAIEKGTPLPVIEQETERRAWNVQRFLLLAGWSWIFIGAGAFVALSAVLAGVLPGEPVHDLPPRGAQFGALIPIGIGCAHLITYWIGEKRAKEEK